MADPEAAGEADDERDEDHIYEPAGEIVAQVRCERLVSHEELDCRIAQERDHDRGRRAQIPRDDQRRDEHRRACELGAEQGIERCTQYDSAGQ